MSSNKDQRYINSLGKTLYKNIIKLFPFAANTLGTDIRIIVTDHPLYSNNSKLIYDELICRYTIKLKNMQENTNN